MANVAMKLKHMQQKIQSLFQISYHSGDPNFPLYLIARLNSYSKFTAGQGYVDD